MWFIQTIYLTFWFFYLYTTLASNNHIWINHNLPRVSLCLIWYTCIRVEKVDSIWFTHFDLSCLHPTSLQSTARGLFKLLILLTLAPPPCVELTMLTQFLGVILSRHLTDFSDVLYACSLLFRFFNGTISLRFLRTGNDTEHPIGEELSCTCQGLLFYIPAKLHNHIY